MLTCAWTWIERSWQNGHNDSEVLLSPRVCSKTRVLIPSLANFSNLSSNSVDGAQLTSFSGNLQFGALSFLIRLSCYLLGSAKPLRGFPSSSEAIRCDSYSNSKELAYWIFAYKNWIVVAKK